jgi:serralysin
MTAYQKRNYDEFIFGTEGRDVIEGGSGDDYIAGLQGTDMVYGKQGDDFIIDSPLNTTKSGHEPDLYFGGQGNDTIVTVSGSDHLSGGTGNDRFVSFNLDTFGVDGGRGFDVAHLHGTDDMEFNTIERNEEGQIDLAIVTDGVEVIVLADVERIVIHHDF